MCTATKVASKSHGYEKTLQGVDASLQRMKFGVSIHSIILLDTHPPFYLLHEDYVDLFLIHDPLSGKQRRLETYRALLEAKAEGKIKSVGVSNL